MINFNEVIEGWRNRLIPPVHLRELIRQVGEDRMEICNVCEYNSKNMEKKSRRPDVHCIICGCTLSAKVVCLSCCCPDTPSRWNALVSQEQEQEIRNEK